MPIPKTGSIYCCSTCGCIDVECRYLVRINRLADPNVLAKDAIVEPDQDDEFFCPDCQRWGSGCLIDVQTKRCEHCTEVGYFADDSSLVPGANLFHTKLKLHEHVPHSER
jgi:hypothetical protein